MIVRQREIRAAPVGIEKIMVSFSSSTLTFEGVNERLISEDQQFSMKTVSYFVRIYGYHIDTDRLSSPALYP
jgi:hypothetical protein